MNIKQINEGVKYCIILCDETASDLEPNLTTIMRMDFEGIVTIYNLDAVQDNCIANHQEFVITFFIFGNTYRKHEAVIDSIQNSIIAIDIDLNNYSHGNQAIQTVHNIISCFSTEGLVGNDPAFLKQLLALGSKVTLKNIIFDLNSIEKSLTLCLEKELLLNKAKGILIIIKVDKLLRLSAFQKIGDVFEMLLPEETEVLISAPYPKESESFPANIELLIVSE